MIEAIENGQNLTLIARCMVGLRECGAFEIVNVQVSPRVSLTYYRLKD